MKTISGKMWKEMRNPESAEQIPKGFNWIAVLSELGNGTECSRNEHDTLCRMAGNWVTCACGQLCIALPRDHAGRPKDHRLASLGTTFFGYVEEKKWCRALDTLLAIEDRTTELLKEKGIQCHE